jgi:hypothetical protein
MELIAFLVVGLITGALAWRKGQNPWLWIACGALTPAAVTISFIILSQRGALTFLGPGMTGWYIDHALCLTPLVIVAFLPVATQDVELQKRSRRRGSFVALGILAVAILIILVAVASRR